MLRRMVLVVGVVLLSVVTVGAQAPESRSETKKPAAAYRGLFGPDEISASRGNDLSLLVSLYEEYGNSPDSEDDRSPVPLVQRNGYFSGVRTDLVFSHRGQRATFGFRTQGSMRYYPGLQAYTGLRHRSEMGLSATVGRMRRTSVTMSGVAEHAPNYSISLFPEPSILNDSPASAANRDDALTNRAANIYNGSFGLEHQFSPRSSFGVDNSVRYANVSGAPGVRDVRTGLRYSRRMSPYFALRLGYAYMRGQYGPTSDMKAIQSHDLDLGIDYRRAITLSRKTTIAFGSGSTMVQTSLGQAYRVTGTATLRTELPQGWIAQVEYNRGLQLVEGFANPFFADIVTPSLGGYLGRRVQLSTSAGYSFGEVGLVGGRYRALQASTRLRVAATRYAAVDAQYLFYRYQFDNTVALMDSLARSMDRGSIRLNLTLWLPLLQ